MHRLLRAILFVGLAALAAVVWRATSLRTGAVGNVAGRVLDGSQPVSGARVRCKGSADSVLTDEHGRFELVVLPRDNATVTAAKEGYLIAGAAASSPLEIQLTALAASDNCEYQWVDPAPSANSTGACGNCHQAIYDEWQTSGHAKSAVNRHFQNLLDGSNWLGESGHGWGLAQEYPEGIAVCWSCHAPTHELNAADSDTHHVQGVVAAGVHCDFCHKIQDTSVAQVGLTHGRFAYKLLRPVEGQLFFGPLDDVDRGEDAYSPLQRESRFCAACHEGTLFGVHVYSTYSEWLASPARQQGRQCQTCHMSPLGNLTNVAPGSGGIERDPQTLASHSFLPGGREAMLRRAVGISFSAERQNDGVTATVRLQTHDVGHCLPTGFIDRQLLLVVEPLDDQERPTAVLSGPRLPAAAGSRLSGTAGRLFAKLLTDAEGSAPAPFWRADVSMADNRLAPEQPEEIAFMFSRATAVVRVRVMYRRFWQAVADSKEWPDRDVIIHDASIAVR